MDVALLKDLDKLGVTPHYTRPDGFGITKHEFAEEKHCSIKQAYNALDIAVRDGVLESHQMLVAGKSGLTLVYHRPGDWPPKESK